MESNRAYGYGKKSSAGSDHRQPSGVQRRGLRSVSYTHLNDPLLVQYGKYMKGLFTGDLGDSIKNGKTVVEAIAPRMKPTIMLTVSAVSYTHLHVMLRKIL